MSAAQRIAPIAPLVEQAAQAGAAAFERGAKCVPCHDPALMGLLHGLQVGEGLPVLIAWSDAWHRANLAAPLPAMEFGEG